MKNYFGLFVMLVLLPWMTWSCGCSAKLLGHRSDMTTELGIHDGYLFSECQKPEGVGMDLAAGFSLLGTGSKLYMDRSPDDEKLAQAFVDEQLSAIKCKKYHCEGGWEPILATNCDPNADPKEVRSVVTVNDWKDADSVIERVSKILIDQDLKENVLIMIGRPLCK